MFRQFKNGKCHYLVMSQVLKNDDGDEYTAYGITVMSGDSMIASIADVTTNYEDILRLRRSCTENELDPIHIYDVIEDFLS